MVQEAEAGVEEEAEEAEKAFEPRGERDGATAGDHLGKKELPRFRGGGQPKGVRFRAQVNPPVKGPRGDELEDDGGALAERGELVGARKGTGDPDCEVVREPRGAGGEAAFGEFLLQGDTEGHGENVGHDVPATTTRDRSLGSPPVRGDNSAARASAEDREGSSREERRHEVRHVGRDAEGGKLSAHVLWGDGWEGVGEVEGPHYSGCLDCAKAAHIG